MNILITGSAGFIGRRLAQHLSPQHAVYGLIHDKPPRPCGWEPMRGDIKDYPRMLEILVDKEIQQVYHFASKSVVRNCKCDPIGCFQTNAMGTVNILEAARHCDTIEGILVAESDKSYGNGPTPYREEQALMPGGIYEASKACVSHIARAYHHNYGVPVYTVRSANVYGPGDGNMTRLVPNTITRLLRGESPQITAGAEKFIREFFYVDDFISDTTKLMELGPWGEAFNVGTGETTSVGNLVKMICALMGKDAEAEEWGKPAGLVEIPEQVLCLDKLNGMIPDRRTLSLRDGLQRTIEWYKENTPCPST